MSDGGNAVSHETGISDAKGKGKAPAEHGQEMSMDEETSSEEEAGEERLSKVYRKLRYKANHGPEEEEEDEDNMEEITTDNIISDGRRTRGRNIDFQKAALDAGDELDEDEDDDDDFVAKDDDDTMQE